MNSPVFRGFKAPRKHLGDLDADAAAALITSAADLALVVDAKGVIRDLSASNDALATEEAGDWVGRAWVDVVTVESRPKVEALLRGARSTAMQRARQINHPLASGADLPILYSAVPVGKDGRVIALGRDLRDAAEVQQRLLQAQHSMERDYARLRQAETRYRLLFSLATEAILVIDAATRRIQEANPAAGQILGDPPERLVGRVFPLGLDGPGSQAITSLLTGLRSSARPEPVRVRRAEGDEALLVTASMFRQEATTHILVRIAVASLGSVTASSSDAGARALHILEALPDGFVLTDPSGRILAANQAFLDLAELATEEQARGEMLDKWLGRAGADLNVLSAGLRQNGAVTLFATTVLGEFGASTDVEISAVAAPDQDPPCLAFSIRNVGRRPAPEFRAGRDLPRSVEQLTSLVGRVSLKDLVRETTDVVEKLCIEAALKITGDNRASAAEMLGVSRQSLYEKLHRHGLGDLGSGTDT